MERLLVFNLATDESDPLLGFGVEWLRRLAARVDHVDVLTMRHGPADLPANVVVHSVGKEAGSSEARRAVTFYAVLFRLLRAHPYDACFAHMMPLFAAMAGLFLRVKRIPITLWYVHSSTTLRLRLAHLMVNRVVTASADSFPLRSRKVIVTGHGIDTELFSPATRSSSGPFAVYCPGRIAPIKRIDVLIRAVAGLDGGASPPMSVRIQGPVLDHDRSYAQKLEEMVTTAGLGGVIFEGPVAHPAMVERYRAADVVVNLSDTDSLDKTVLEAMSCGIPVVTSNAACARVVARVRPPLAVGKNDPAAVAAALRWVGDMEPTELHRLGEELRALVVREHGLQQLIDRLIDEVLVPGERAA